MNLYWKRIFGKIASTEKVEAEYEKCRRIYERYKQVSQSKELAEYNELFNTVKSSEFKENKRTLKTRKYKDTQWYRDMTKFNKLDHNPNIHRYYEILDSKELTEYLIFKDSPNYVKLGQPKEVKASEELTRLKHFETSKDYKIYTRFHNSYIIREYQELKEKVSHPEFKKNNLFWADNNRWNTTKECQIENRYFELDKNEDIQFYLKTKSESIETMNRFNISFEDAFNYNTLPAKDWTYGFAYTKPELVKRHSFANEQQANVSGKNTAVVNGELHISTKQEKIEALAWHQEKGFVMKDYEYTADVINCRNAANFCKGIFTAKIKINGSRNVNHAFWLASSDRMPHINIARLVDGAVEVGIYWKSKFEENYTSTRVTGLKLQDYYIYTLVWTEKELIWYVNNFEVFRTSDFVPTCEMAPVFNSFLPEGKSAGTGDMVIDYVKVFRFNEQQAKENNETKE